ncbi:MAG: protein kinase [Simkaniaceae bacterium]|nr:MAG: protein kinase [Simkaniaceae bacterium]
MEREDKPKDSDKEKKTSGYSFPFQLDRYMLVDLIGSGGMGEVFLAEDPICGRKVALKRIIAKRKGKESARRRFKKEVRIAAQLSHPSIIPIYDLYDEGENLYYTMPYLEGKTLKEILIATRVANEHGHPLNVMGGSIPSLMLAFLNICQASEHTHEKGFIHRDLKPENIIIGKYNEVTILDWGVATEIFNPEGEEERKQEINHNYKGRTNPRGAAGTIEYMAPERAFAQPASIQSDIYSLGVILHFMLTLEVPYKRPTSIKEWRELLNRNGPEPPIDPQDVAPYREITQQLSRITLKCLHPDTDKRYQSVRDIITDLQRYIQGRPDWILTEQFDINNPANWEFQESVMLTKQVAISRYAGVMEWILLMLSKESYSGNIQIQATVRIQEEGGGIGFMMCVPSNSGREGLEKGYLVWIGSKDNPGLKLFRDNVEVTRVEDIFLEPDETYIISIEKQDNVLRLLINDEPKLTHLSHVPIVGGHFGLASKDVEFEISPISLSTGSQNVLVNCLSVPDAFLLSGDYGRALMEYRRIAHSFKGRPEGREATFRAGFTLIEEGKKKKGKAKEYFARALDEFELLHKTPGAPIEYLGKSLVYQAENNLEEEVKCLELAARKFPKHPLRYVLDEHILFRLHETAQKDRIGAYAFTLLTLRHVPRVYNLAETDRLTRNLTVSWEDLPFIKTPPSFSSEAEESLALSILLSFWLARPGSLYELIQGIPETFKHRLLLLENGLLALLELGYPKLIEFIISVKYRNESDPEFLLLKNLYEIAIDDSSLPQKIDLVMEKASDRLIYSLFAKGLTLEEAPKLLTYFERTNQFEELHIWALLLSGKKREPGKLFEGKPIQDSSSLYFLLYGCYLAATDGEAAALSHFDSLLETTFPRSPALLAHFLKNNIDIENSWFRQAFFWEKVQLYKQLTLYYICLGKPRKAAQFEGMIQKEFSKYEIPLNFI